MHKTFELTYQNFDDNFPLRHVSKPETIFHFFFLRENAH